MPNYATSLLFACERADLLGSNIRSLYTSLKNYKRFQEEIEREGFVRDFAAEFRTRALHLSSASAARLRQAPAETPIITQCT